MARVTLEEIGARAGVSKASVSMALRGHPNIPEETRERIRRIAEEMGYRLSPLLSAHMSAVRGSRKDLRTEVIAFLNFIERSREKRAAVDYYLAGARYRAKRIGFRIERFDCDAVGTNWRSLDRMLYNRGIVGVIVGPFPDSGMSLDLSWERYCGVTIGHQVSNPSLHRVAFDNFETTVVAMEELTLRGYGKIGLALRRGDSSRVNFLALSGYQNFFLRRRSKALPHLLFENGRDLRKRLPPWLEKHKFDVVLSSRVSVADALADAGKRVPQDVGFLNLNRLSGKDPFAGIDCSYFDIGAMAVDGVSHLLNHFETGVPTLPTVSLVPGRIVEGYSIRLPNGT